MAVGAEEGLGEVQFSCCGEKQWCWCKLRGGQSSPNPSGDAQEVPMGCWLSPVVQGDGGDGCVLTQQGEMLAKGRHQVIPVGGTSRKLPGDGI